MLMQWSVSRVISWTLVTRFPIVVDSPSPWSRPCGGGAAVGGGWSGHGSGGGLWGGVVGAGRTGSRYDQPPPASQPTGPRTPCPHQAERRPERMEKEIERKDLSFLNTMVDP